MSQCGAVNSSDGSRNGRFPDVVSGTHYPGTQILKCQLSHECAFLDLAPVYYWLSRANAVFVKPAS